MKKLLITTAIVTSFTFTSFASHAAQEKMQKEQAIGLGAGTVVGAIVGGPIGAFIGAFTGSLIGTTEVNKQQIVSQQRALDEQTLQLTAMAEKTQNYQELVAQSRQLETQLEQLENEKLTLQQQKLNRLMAMTVQFRTGSDKIEPHFAKQLDELAQVLKNNPEFNINLNGFADQRGGEAFNLALSKSRVAKVQQYLIKQGVDHNMLSTHAFGESKVLAKQADYEGDFFDRKVTVELKPINNQTQTASNNY